MSVDRFLLRIVRPSTLRKLCAAAAAVASPLMATAADGTWSSATNANWETAARWTGSTIADGAGSTATFSLNVPAAGLNVTLTASREIGSLVFNDTDTGSSSIGNWNLTDASVAGRALTLAGGSPTVTVNNMGAGAFARIDLELAGTAGLTKSGAGTLVLAGGNSFTGGITMHRGTLQVGNGTIGSIASQALTFVNASTANFVHTPDSAVSMGELSFSTGAGNVTSTYGGGNNTLTFSSISRSADATGNFTTNGGDSATNRIVLTGQSAGFMSEGLFFGGSNYAWYDGAGFVRGVNWGVDADSSTAAGGVSLASTKYAQTTAAVSAQATETFTVLNIVNAANSAQQFKLASGAVLTTNGILRSGNGGTSSTTTISVGSIQAATDAELVLRSDLSNDLLTISSNIIANGVNRLTKTGAGTVTLSGNNSYTGITTVLEGTLTAGSATAFGSTEIDVVGGVLSAGNNALSNTINLKGGSMRGANIFGGTINVLANSNFSESSNSNMGVVRINGTLNVAAGTTLSVSSSNGNIAINGTLTGGGLIDNQNLGSFTISGANPDFSGAFAVRRGTLALGNDQALGEGALSLNSASGTIVVRSNDSTLRTIANPVTFGTGVTFGSSTTGPLTFTGPVSLGASVRSLPVFNTTRFEGDISGAGGGIVLAATSTGTLVLAGKNTYTGATSLAGGTLQLDGSLTSPVTVWVGTLTGKGGSTTSTLTIGNGTGTADAVVAPGAGIGTLSAGGLLRIRDDGVLQAEIDSATLLSDRIVAAGVTLDALSTLSLSDLSDGLLSPAQSFTLIENTALNAVSGTFAGLLEGHEFAVGGNTFTISYAGGDGNDVVITSVPEPGAVGVALCGMVGALLRRRSRRGN